MPRPKSKATKRKMRRWQYIVHVTKDGRTGTFKSPALTIGTSRLAGATADQIKADLSTLPQFEGATLRVEPVGGETISAVVLEQLNGLSDENKVLIRVIKDQITDNLRKLRDDYPSELFSKQVTEMLGELVLTMRQTMITEKQVAAQAAAEAMGGTAELVTDPVALQQAVETAQGVEDMDAADAAAQNPDTLSVEQELDLGDPAVTTALDQAFAQAAKRLSAPGPEELPAVLDGACPACSRPEDGHSFKHGSEPCPHAGN